MFVKFNDLFYLLIIKLTLTNKANQHKYFTLKPKEGNSANVTYRNPSFSLFFS